MISDTHFDDSDRDAMGYKISEEEQISIIKRCVHKNDTLIHLGDVGNPEYMKQIRGHKVLILGNHDWSATKFKPYFDEVYAGPLFIGERILLSHEPIHLGNLAFNFHGHDHNPLCDWSYNYMNLASNVIEYEPQNLGKLIKDGILSHVDGIHRQTVDLAISNNVKE